MGLDCKHIMFNVSDVAEAKSFFIDKLGCELLEDHPRLFAFRTGGVRFSVFGGGRKLTEEEGEDANTSVLFATEALESTIADLKSKDVRFLGDVIEAPGFMKFIQFLDMDNNRHYLAEYLRDPLIPA